MIDANAAKKSSKPVIKPRFDQESYKKDLCQLKGALTTGTELVLGMELMYR